MIKVGSGSFSDLLESSPQICEMKFLYTGFIEEKE